MKEDVIRTIGNIVTSPYPYFALFGYFGLEAFKIFANKEANYYYISIFGLLILFLSFLCILVFVLIQKVGHSSMLSPEYQVEIEKLNLAKENAKLKLEEMSQKELSDV